MRVYIYINLTITQILNFEKCILSVGISFVKIGYQYSPALNVIG